MARFDYIARDCHAIGEKGNLSLTRCGVCVCTCLVDRADAFAYARTYRLIHSARVIDGQVCYDIKDAEQIYELCYTRFSLHKRIYNHKTGTSMPSFLSAFCSRSLLTHDTHAHI